MPAARRLWPLVAAIALLWCAIVALGAMGRGALAAPPVLDPQGWSRWAAQRDAITISFAALRVGALVLAWYLLGTTVLGATARLTRRTRLILAADLLALPPVRHVLQATLGGLAAAAITAGAAIQPVMPDPAGHRGVDVELITARTPGAPPDRKVPFAEAPAPPGAPDLREHERRWKAGTGDHLWSIAQRCLARAWDRAPTDSETAAYWTALIDANRDRLVDPRNPDLIHPGQTFRLPEKPAGT